MADFAGQFGVTLKAFTEVDRASLGRAQKDVGQALGKKMPDGGIGQAEKKVAQGAAGARHWARAIDDVKSRLRTSWHLDGVGRAVDQLREGRRQLNDLGDRAGKLLSPIGGLMAATSLAGIGSVVESFGSRSGGLLRLSGNMGVTAGFLQRIQGGAELAGVSAEGATGAIDTLQQNLRAAQLGLPEGARAIGAAKLLGISVNDNPENFLKNLAAKMQGQAPLVQRAMAEAFGVGDLLPMLRQGRQAMEEYMAAAKTNRDLSDDQIRAGRQLELAYSGATQATLGLKDAIGAQLAPTFVPLLTTWNDWMNDVKDSPGKLKLATEGVEALGIAFGVSLVAGVTKATLAMNAWWALPSVRFLVKLMTWRAGSLLSVPAVGAGLGVFFGGKATGGNEITPEANQPGFQNFLDQHTMPQGWGNSFWNRLKPGQAVAPQGMVAPPQGMVAPPTGNVPSIPMPSDTGLSGTELSINNFGGLRRPGVNAGPVGGGFQSFATPELGVQATAHLLQTYQDRHGVNTLRSIINRWAPPFENNTAKLIADAVQQTGFGADQPLNLHDATTLSAVAAAMIRNEVGVRGPSRDMVNNVISGLTIAGASAPANTQVASASVPANTQVASASVPANTQVASAGHDYMMSPAAEASLADWYQGADTQHHVIVDINGAPQGTRTRVASANGPSDLTVRTQTAFQTP